MIDPEPMTSSLAMMGSQIFDVFLLQLPENRGAVLFGKARIW